MKIRKQNAGVLTNFEVHDFFVSRGASKDPTRVMAPITPSEYKVYDYLILSAAPDQTRDSIGSFIKKTEQFGLAKAEILNIINIRPLSLAQLYPITEESENRFGEEKMEELLDMVMQVFPPKESELIACEEAAEEEEVNEENGNEEETAAEQTS